MRTRKRMKEPSETPQPITADDFAQGIDEFEDGFNEVEEGTDEVEKGIDEVQKRQGEPPIWANVRIHPLSLLHSSHILPRCVC